MMRDIGLTAAQIAGRRNFIGGSDATILMSGDDDRIENLFLVKRGEIDSDDLSDILPVVMGQFTEELNRYWFCKQLSTTVTDVGEQCVHEDYDFIGCTLDGMTKIDGELMLFEAKHVGPFNYSLEATLERYQPQLQHCMAVCNCDKAALSVFSGNSKWEWEKVESDPFYQKELLEREIDFWRCVESGAPPPRMPKIEAPDGKADQTLDLSRDNQWCATAQDFLTNLPASKACDEAKKNLKGMVPADVLKAVGGGIIAKRDKRGGIRFTEDI